MVVAVVIAVVAAFALGGLSVASLGRADGDLNDDASIATTEWYLAVDDAEIRAAMAAAALGV